jgi:transposase
MELNQEKVQPKTEPMLGRILCATCFEKQREIDRLKEELQRVKAENARLKQKGEQSAKDGPFGSSTPSSKIPFKAASKEENKKKVGGRKDGHPGSGRRGFTGEEAARVEDIEIPDGCPECGGPLKNHGERERWVLELVIHRLEKILYKIKRGYCPRCKKVKEKQPASVYPRFFYGNNLLAYTLTFHYGYGITLGKILRIIGTEVTQGGLIQAFHQIAVQFKRGMPQLIEEYRQSLVKHADETTWRTNGDSGYTWIFCTLNTVIFDFARTRAGHVVTRMMGTKPLPGVLVVDRYAGYNQAPCPLQYCYAHLLRDVGDLKKEFPDQPEVIAFVEHLATLLAKALKLRTEPITDEEYYEQAKEVKCSIEQAAQAPANHLGIRSIQNIFIDKKERLYHWVTDRNIPPENNYAERTARLLVIARNTSMVPSQNKGQRLGE